jgi:hypothetical protein
MLNTSGREPISNRARFASVEDGFNIQRPPLEPRAFDAERDRALDPSTPSGAILLDMRDTLMTLYPATTPLLLAKFPRIRAGEEIRVRLKASAEIYYVLQTGLSRMRALPRNKAGKRVSGRIRRYPACRTNDRRGSPALHGRSAAPGGSQRHIPQPACEAAQFNRSSVMCRGSGLNSLRSTRLTMSVSTALALHERPTFSPSRTTKPLRNSISVRRPFCMS